MKISQAELDEGVKKHGMHLRCESGGEKLDLRWANLQEANLQEANLQGADLRGAKLPHFQICPEEGAFIAWKKAGSKIVKLSIPAEAKRTSSLIGRKCRAEFVDTLWIFVDTLGTEDGSEKAISGRGGVYEVGKRTHPDKYCDDIRIECSSGIHFFMTRKEAEEW